MFIFGVIDLIMVFCGIYKEIVIYYVIYLCLISLIEKVGILFLGVYVIRYIYVLLLLDSGVIMKEV